MTQTVVPGAARRLLTRRLQRREEGESGARREQTPGLLARHREISHLSRPGCTPPRAAGAADSDDRRTKKTPRRAAAPVVAPELALDERTDSSCCISARALSNSSLPHKPPHRRPSKVREPTLPHGIPFFLAICAQEPSVPLKVNRGPAAIYRSGLTDNPSHREVRRLLWLP